MKVTLWDDPVKIGKQYWFPCGDMICSYNEETDEVKTEKILDVPDVNLDSFCSIAFVDNKIVCAPYVSRDIAIYDLATQSVEFLNWGNTDIYSYYRHVVAFENKVFLLPGLGNSNILVLDGWKRIRRIDLSDWGTDIKREVCTAEYVVQDKYLWITAYYSRQVLKLDMHTEKYEWIEIGENSVGYSGITLDQECIWLAESSTGAFVQYDTRNGRTEKYDAPVELDYNSSEKTYVHLRLFNFDKCIISVPALSDKMTMFQKKTGEIESVKIGFLSSVSESKLNYKNVNSLTCSFGKKIDEKTLWVQRAVDGAIASINIDNFTYTVFALELKEKELSYIRTKIYQSVKKGVPEDNLISLNSFIAFLEDKNEEISKQQYSGVGTKIWAAMK